MSLASPTQTAPPDAGSPKPNDNRRKILEATMRRHQYRPDGLIEVLHKAQELYGYLDPALLSEIAVRLHVPPSRVYGVATFYHLFVLEPPGEHSCTICLGTACYVRGGVELLAAVEAATGLKGGRNSAMVRSRCASRAAWAPVGSRRLP